MNLNLESITKNRPMGRKRLTASLVKLGWVLFIFYVYIWYIAPTSPLARLPNCIGAIFSDQSSRLDASDGMIEGIFIATESSPYGHGVAYSTLVFSEGRTVSHHYVSDIVGVRGFLIWVDWFEKKSFKYVDPPNYSRRNEPFWAHSYETVIYTIDGENFNFVLYDPDYAERWNGIISGENLTFKIYIDEIDKTYEAIYSRKNYDTCPSRDEWVYE